MIELVTPAAPGLFLPLAATATFVRTAALTGRGSLVNGSLMQHFARNENTADVRARLEVQGRWLALVALPVGIGIFRTVSQTFATDPEEPWSDVDGAGAFYGGVVCAHLVCIWNAASFCGSRRSTARRLCARRAFRRGADAMPTSTRRATRRSVSREVLLRRSILGASLPDAARDWAPRASRRARGSAGREERRFGGESRKFGGSHVGRRFAVGWDPRDGGRPAVLADATPRDVLAAALAGVHASTGCGAGTTEGSGGYAWGTRVDEFGRRWLRTGGAWFVQLGTASRYRLGSLLGESGGGDGAGRGKEGGGAGDDVLAT